MTATPDANHPPLDRSWPGPLAACKVLRTLGARWMDIDVDVHDNNVDEDSWFDASVNASLIEQGVPDIHDGQ